MIVVPLCFCRHGWLWCIGEDTPFTGRRSSLVSSDVFPESFACSITAPLGLQFNTVAGHPQPHRVRSLTKGGNAGAAGVARGMRILTVEGTDVAGMAKGQVGDLLRGATGPVRMTFAQPPLPTAQSSSAGKRLDQFCRMMLQRAEGKPYWEPVRGLLCKMLAQEVTADFVMVQTNLRAEFANVIPNIQADVHRVHSAEADRLVRHFSSIQDQGASTFVEGEGEGEGDLPPVPNTARPGT